MAKFKPYRKDQLHLLPSCLEDYVPERHLARVVYVVVESSYNGQVVVEESHGVIVAATLSNNPADDEALAGCVEQTEENTGDKPSEVLGDSGFFSYENLQYLEEKGIEGYIPEQGMESLRKGSRQDYEFHRSRLI